MSWYTNYYLGFIKPDNMIYPLGPFNHKGKFKSIISTSRSFTTSLVERFHPVSDEQVSDELKAALLTNPDITSNYAKEYYLGYAKLHDLPSDDYIKRGYFLIDDIKQYLRDNDYCTYDLFYSSMDPVEYAMRLCNEQIFGETVHSTDDENIEPSCRDYSYFAYPDYNSEEYEIHLLSAVASMLMGYSDLTEDSEVVVIKTEG